MSVKRIDWIAQDKFLACAEQARKKLVKIMARFITMDGVEKFVTPQNNKKFTLKEAQKYVGGYVEVVYLNDNIICLCNEEGLLNGLQVNQMATVAMQLCGWQGGPIVGNVIICKEDEF